MDKMSLFLLALYDYGDSWGQGADEKEIQQTSRLSLRDIFDAGEQARDRGFVKSVSTHDHANAWMLSLRGKSFVESLRE